MADLWDDVELAVRQSFLAGNPKSDMVRQAGMVVEYPAGHRVIQVSGPTSFGIVIRGLARVFIQRPDGSELTVRRVKAGAAVGIAALFADVKGIFVAPTGVDAITECRILHIRSAEVVRLAHDDPRIAWNLATELAARLGDTYLELIAHGHPSVQKRLARLLLDMTEGGDGFLVVRRSQESLAEMVGCARETTSLALRRLRDLGLVRLRRGAVEILDAERLSQSARPSFEV